MTKTKAKAPAKIKAPATKAKATKKDVKAASVKAKPDKVEVSVKVAAAVGAPRSQSAKVSLKGVSEVKKATEKIETDVKVAKKKRTPKVDADADKPSQLGQKWSSLYRKTQEQATPYNMRQAYEAKTPIMHKLLGWGYIMTNKNDRLEVLFKDGIRYLISNYKA